MGELGPGRLEGQADAGGVSDGGHRGDGPGKAVDRYLVRPSAGSPSGGLHRGGTEPVRHFDSQDEGVSGALPRCLVEEVERASRQDPVHPEPTGLDLSFGTIEAGLVEFGHEQGDPIDAQALVALEILRKRPVLTRE